MSGLLISLFMLGSLGGFFVGEILNDVVFQYLFLCWTDSLGENFAFFYSKYKHLFTGILEVKLQFLLSELVTNIDIQLNCRCFQLWIASSSQNTSVVKFKNFC